MFYIHQIKLIATKNKYSKWYTSIILNALSRWRLDYNLSITQNRRHAKKSLGYFECHHIVPKSFKIGGESDISNCVFLTAKEHYICHLLLTKMFVGIYKNKMVFAFRQMHVSNKYNQRYTGKQIALLKPAIPPANKDKISITNGVITKYYNKFLPLPLGWVVGRSPKNLAEQTLINNQTHRYSFLITNLLLNTEFVVTNLKEWADSVNIPYTTITSSARLNNIIRKTYRVKKLAKVFN